MRCFYGLVLTALFPGVESRAVTSLRLSDAVSRALEHNPIVLQEREKEQAAKQALYKAYSTLVPELRGSLGLSQNKDALTSASVRFNGEWFNSYSAQIEARSTLYGGGAILGTLRSLQKDRELAAFARQRVERQIRRDVLLHFFKLLLSERQVQNIRNRQRIQQELLKTAEARYRIGNEQALSVMQIKTGLLLLAPQVAQAENAVQIAANELGNLLGMSSSETLSVSGSLRPPKDLSLLVQNRREVGIRLEQQEARLRLAKVEDTRVTQMAVHLPRLDAYARWGRNTFRRSDLLDNDATQTQIGLNLQIPIFSGLGSVFERRALAAQEAIARIEDRKLSDTFELERVKAEKNFRFSVTQAETYQQALSQAEESVRVANRTYRLGTSTYLQVSDAQRNLAEAEINFETAQFEVLQKTSDLYVANAWFLEEWVESLEKHYLGMQKE